MTLDKRPRAPRQQRAIKTRAELLQSAIRMFARRGVSATSLADLARSIGMTPGVLYFHFPRKEDLVHAAIEQLNADFTAAFTSHFTPAIRELPATAQLRAFFATAQAFLSTPPEYGIFFGMVAAESAESQPLVAQALRESLGRYAAILGRLVAHGQRTGEFRADVDPVVFGHMTLGAYIGLYTYQHLFDAGRVEQLPIPVLNELVFAGLAAATPAARARKPRSKRPATRRG